MAQPEHTSTGCWIPPNRVDEYFSLAGQVNLFETGSEHIEPRSGDPTLDKALAHALSKIARTFGVLPAFAYYDDGNSPNAKATPEKLMDRADGTVLFGRNFLRQLVSGSNRPDAAIVAVCAHEFGHITSYKNSMIRSLAPVPDRPFHAEQFADFMAGYYAGQRRLEDPAFPSAVIATTQRHFGGGDHGNGKQRGEAVQQGFLAAYRDHMGPYDAKQAALNYALAQTLEY
ncbi:MAG: M48 family metalloprotease [Rhodanobacter sp.]